MAESTHELLVRAVSALVFRAPPSVRCLGGTLWLTRRGDPVDYIVGKGERSTFPSGKWLIEAVDEARFEIEAHSAVKEAAHGKTSILPVFFRV